MANDPKVRLLYDDFYKEVGVAAAWTPPSKIRVYRDALLKGRVKPGPRNSAADKARLARIASKAPEVMIKVTGRTGDAAHLKAHMDYITRNGKVAAETDYGAMKGKDAVRDLYDDWMDDDIIYGGQHQIRKAPLSVNMMLSMPPGVDRDAFRNAVRDFVDAELRKRADVMVAFHDDTEHPHAHVTVRGRQHDGKTFNPQKPVLARFREQFAGALRHRGIEAEATPRYARGQTMKSERLHMRHMRTKGLMPRTESAAILDAFRDLERARNSASLPEDEGKSRPWVKVARERHAGVMAVYAAAVRELAASANPSDRQLAQQVEQFVRSMPAPMFAHDLYKQALERQLAERAKLPPTTVKQRDRPER
ncbi:type VI secretion protein [Phyllobacterium brassicacearum]|uniref:Type VI secretion protein n=1 Tax=Phyllobacterium brassicacearum TaxID=314235 RepID=A0A2P7BBC1_9HYPH|nr:relaxase/mobilization nuclease domain-containing protein [Phyllobacterium brassicacearum]PSH63760.1 type VI secretion protein [Phyllobacterium brassicacearum]TDQ31954.1 relaxase/mobilization nuclease-like protein [Phyllobacterium brassicacearum]